MRQNRGTIPVVGTKGVHAIQLSPELRKLLHHRAAEAARREFEPVLAADRGALGAVNRTYRTEAGAARNSTQMVQGILANALGSLKGSGLKGGYLKQAVNELGARQASSASSLPFLLADAQEARSKGLTEGRQQIASDRASYLQSVASGFNSLLGSARSTASQTTKEREEHRRSREQDERQEHHGVEYDPTNLANAKIALRDALTLWAEDPTIKLEDNSFTTAKKMNPLRSASDWAAFAQKIDEQFDGFDLKDIERVLHQYLSPRRMHEGRVPQPGVPFNPGYRPGLVPAGG